MKTFDIKKHLCIFIGIILLISSTQTFSQEENVVSSIVSQQEIEELTTLARQIRAKYNLTLKNISGTSNLIDYVSSNNSVIIFKNPYVTEERITNAYKVYYQQINELAEQVQLFQSKMRDVYTRYLNLLPEDTYLQKVTANYLNGRMNTLFNAQNRHLNNLLSISDVIEEHPKIEDISSSLKPVYFQNMDSRYNYLKTQYEKESRIRNEFIKDLADNQAYYQRTFSEDTDKLIKQLQKVESSLSRETIEFFSKKTYNAEEVLRYFEARLPEEQKAVLFALKVADNDQTIAELIPHIRYYLKHTNRRLWKLDKFSAEKLAVTLSKMDLAKRVDYIDDLLDFAPETMALRKEIKTAEKSVGKKIISRKKIKLSGTFIAIGAFLLASTITEVKADNNFRGAISPYRLAQIKHKIDEGQMITLQELSAYYTDERNSEEIIKNPKGLFEAFEIAITINDCLDSLYAKEPPANTKKQVEDNIDKRLQEVNWKKVTFKVGTL